MWTRLLTLLLVAMTSSWPSLAVLARGPRDVIRRVARSSDHDQASLAFLSVEASTWGDEDNQFKQHITLDIESTGEQLRMSLTPTKGVNTSGIRIFEHNEEGRRELKDIKIPDCFYDGRLTSGQGSAVLSLCDNDVMGSIVTESRHYSVLPLPRVEGKSGTDKKMVLLTWKDEDVATTSKFLRDDVVYIPIPDSDNQEKEITSQGQTSGSDTVTVEIGNYLDIYYIQDCKDKLGRDTNQQLTNLQLLKFSQAEKILNSGGLKYKVALKVSEIHIMRTSPSWYITDPSDKIGDRLKTICQGTKNSASYDQITLSTSRTSNPGIIGLSYIGGVCKPEYRCSVSRAVNVDYWTELHEMGHSLGLNHDELMPDCKDDPGPQGFMSMNRDVFRACYKRTLEKTFSDKTQYRCLWENNEDW